MIQSLELTGFERECLEPCGEFWDLPRDVQTRVLFARVLEGICKEVNRDLPSSPQRWLSLPFVRWYRLRRFRRRFRHELDRMSRQFNAKVRIAYSRRGQRKRDKNPRPRPLSLGIAIGIATIHPSSPGGRKWRLWILYLLVPRANRQALWGDLLEDRHDLLRAGCPRWQANTAALVEVVDMVWRRPWLFRFAKVVGAVALLEFVRRVLEQMKL